MWKVKGGTLLLQEEPSAITCSKQYNRECPNDLRRVDLLLSGDDNAQLGTITVIFSFIYTCFKYISDIHASRISGGGGGG